MGRLVDPPVALPRLRVAHQWLLTEQPLVLLKSLVLHHLNQFKPIGFELFVSLSKTSDAGSCGLLFSENSESHPAVALDRQTGGAS